MILIYLQPEPPAQTKNTITCLSRPWDMVCLLLKAHIPSYLRHEWVISTLSSNPLISWKAWGVGGVASFEISHHPLFYRRYASSKNIRIAILVFQMTTWWTARTYVRILSTRYMVSLCKNRLDLRLVRLMLQLMLRTCHRSLGLYSWITVTLMDRGRLLRLNCWLVSFRMRFTWRLWAYLPASIDCQRWAILSTIATIFDGRERSWKLAENTPIAEAFIHVGWSQDIKQPRSHFGGTSFFPSGFFA